MASENLLLIPVDDSVVFPNMTVTLAIEVGDAERVVLVPREGDEFASVGTVANVVDRVRLPGGGRAVALEGQHRGRIGAASTDATGALRVEVEAHPALPTSTPKHCAEGRGRRLHQGIGDTYVQST